MMICPMNYPGEPCDPECAWLVEPYEGKGRFCAIAVIASSGTEPMLFGPVNEMERDES